MNGWGLTTDNPAPGSIFDGRVDRGPDMIDSGPPGPEHHFGVSIPARAMPEPLPDATFGDEPDATQWVSDLVFSGGTDRVTVSAASSVGAWFREHVPAVVAATVAVAVATGGGVWLAAGDSSNPQPSPSAAATATTVTVPVGTYSGSSVPGYTEAAAWTVPAAENTARGVTRLGLVLVAAGSITLHDIATGKETFTATAAQAVTKTFAASVSAGGPDTLFWVEAPGVADAVTGAATPQRLWWKDGDKAQSTPVGDGCEVSASGTQPLVTCDDSSVWWLGPAGALVRIPTSDEEVVLGVADGQAVSADTTGITITDLSSGAVNLFTPAVPDGAGDGQQLVTLRWLGLGEAGVVSLWGSPQAGVSGQVWVAVHDFSGKLLSAVQTDGSEVAQARMGRGSGGARGFVGPVVIDLASGGSWLLPAGCTATDGQGVVARVGCVGSGDGLFVAGKLFMGSSTVAATSADGQWALLVDSAGNVTGHSLV